MNGQSPELVRKRTLIQGLMKTCPMIKDQTMRDLLPGRVVKLLMGKMDNGALLFSFFRILNYLCIRAPP